MKRGLITSLIALAFLNAANAYSADGLYVSGNVGMAWLNDSDANDLARPGVTWSREFDTGPAFNAAVGYGMQNLRVEGEFGYQKNDFNKQNALGFSSALDGDVTALSFLVNGYYDIPTGSNFTPFITAGIGLARVDVNDLTVPGLRMAPFNGDDTVLAGQVGAGVSYALNEKLNVDLKYRYFMTDNLEFSRGNTLDGLTSHNVYLGVRYSF